MKFLQLLLQPTLVQPILQPVLCVRLTLVAICFGFLVPNSNAELSVAGVFGDHMVIQRQKEIKIWGWAEAGQNIEVEMDGSTSVASADPKGRWEATLPAKEAGGPHKLSVRINGSSDDDAIVIKDILIGEVWLCSSQSNMEWPVARSKDAKQEIAAADFPEIRHFKVERRPSDVAIDNITSDWIACSPETVGKFTAVGYYFGRKLHKELGVPIGLVNSSWGGTRVEPWTPPVGFKNVPALDSIYSELQLRTRGTDENRRLLQQHIAEVESWLESAKEYADGDPADANTPIATSPEFPQELVPLNGRQDTATLYHGMIHGLVGFPLRGAIWYQGESNHKEGMLYFEKKKALIQGWREIWNQGEFPFYFVQIAPFKYGVENPHILPRLWEAQSQTLELPNTGMVVISDIGNLDKEIAYDVDRSEEIGSFSRIAYLLELAKENEETKWVFVSMDAFTDDANKIGLPTFQSEAVFQQAVDSLSVFSNADGIKTGEQMAGSIEFWPHNYSAANSNKIEEASDGKYDFGDARSQAGDYGSMQVHLPGEQQTVFAINHWTVGKDADIGIGNSKGRTLDWTFTKSSSDYVTKRLRVFVLPKQ